MIPFAFISTFLAIVIIVSSYFVGDSSFQIGVVEASQVIQDPSNAQPNAPLISQASIQIPLIVSAIAVFIFFYSRFAIWPDGADARLKTRPPGITRLSTDT